MTRKTWIVLLGVALAVPVMAAWTPNSRPMLLEEGSGAEAKRRRKRKKRKRSLRRHIQPIFNRYCIKCHRGKKAPLGLDLTRKKSHASLVSVDSKQTESRQRVYPGMPAMSYIVFKLTGQHKHPNVGGKGARMPKGRKYKIPGYYRDRIIVWIEQGAKKN